MHTRIDNSPIEDYENCNTEVIVFIEEENDRGELQIIKYVASFFTYKNLWDMVALNKANNVFLGGFYFYSKNMLVLHSCHLKDVTRVVNDLIENGEFTEVFRKIT